MSKDYERNANNNLSYTAFRPVVLRKKGNQCTICGSDKEVHVHHKDGNKSNNRLSNLVPLCEKHHKMVHRRNETVKKISELSRSLPDEENKEHHWIKAKLADDTHDKLRARVQNDDRPTHEVAAELIERAMECDNA